MAGVELPVCVELCGDIDVVDEQARFCVCGLSAECEIVATGDDQVIIDDQCLVMHDVMLGIRVDWHFAPAEDWQLPPYIS
jgi:hypothetical protein